MICSCGLAFHHAHKIIYLSGAEDRGQWESLSSIALEGGYAMPRAVIAMRE